MKIYLMRHAEAVLGSAWGGKDRDRPLSARGEAALQAVLPVIGAQIPKPDILLSSPFLRAAATAELMVRAWGNLPLVELPELASGARSDDYRHALQLHRQASSVFVVGHIPDLAMFAGRLTTEARLLEDPVAPGDILAIDTLDEGVAWGSGHLAWRKRLNDWK